MIKLRVLEGSAKQGNSWSTFEIRRHSDLARSAKRLNLPRYKSSCSSCTGCFRNETLNIFLRLEDTRRWLWWNLYSLGGTNATWQNFGCWCTFIKQDMHDFHVINFVIKGKWHCWKIYYLYIIFQSYCLFRFREDSLHVFEAKKNCSFEDYYWIGRKIKSYF